MSKNCLAVVVLLFSLTVQGELLANNTAPDGRPLMSSAFTCATYAHIFNDFNEEKRLFKVGYAAGKEVYAHTSHQPDLDTIAETSIDFLIGMSYQRAIESTFDSVAKPNTDPSKWPLQEEWSRIATRKYQDSNCMLLK